MNLRYNEGDNYNLYDQGTPVIYTIVLSANGGTVEETKIKNALVYSDLPIPTRVGYIFDGWFTSKSAGVEVKNGDPLHAFKAHTLYAHWTPITYTVVFNLNGGSGYVPEVEASYGKSYAIDKSGLIAPEGFKFKEWSTEPDGTGTIIKSTAKIKNLSTKDGDVVTLYAQWK
jgi:uncharacterized repeat protein (TIGR02543 family)